ncbi:MAG: penicillin-binding protein [Deltaproteobacteria bacterium]|nr:penicillin-binding protein [Deltaproteobacteria bacterium]
MPKKLTRKSVAPMLLFLVIFLFVISLLIWLSRSGKERTKVKLHSVNVEAASKTELIQDWKKFLNTSNGREKNGVFEQLTPGGLKISYSIDPSLQAYTDSLFKLYNIPYAAAFMYSLKDGRVLIFRGRSEKDPRLTDMELILKPWAPAASVFKVVSASAFIASGKMDLNETICYHGGSHRLTPKLLIENPQKDKECTDLSLALAKSANVVFARLGNRLLTRKALLYHGSLWGFNSMLDFELPVEKSTLSILARDQNSVAFTSAGFGKVTLSPFHAAWIMSVVANGGVGKKPFLVETVTDENGKKIYSRKKGTLIPSRVIDESEAKTLATMLRKTVTAGTARTAFYKDDEPRYGFTCSGKTGTLARTEPEYLEYNWFAGYAPSDNPEVAFAIGIINPAKWRTKSIYLAAMILKKYFEKYSRKDNGK